MSTLKAHNIEPATGTDVALGASGDTVTVSGDSLKLNTFKDAGGNTLFTSNGSGTLSSVNSGLKGGGPILIQSQTASSSASISFTSGIDSTYDKYMFVFINMNPASDAVTFRFQANASGQSGFNEVMTTTVFTASHYESGSSPLLTYSASADQANDTNYQRLSDNIGNGADESCSGVFYLFAPSSTTYVKQFYGTTNTYGDSDYTAERFVAGYFNITTAITEMDFKMSSGNFDGKIKMYGIA